jgi:hypothetical protein
MGEDEVPIEEKSLPETMTAAQSGVFSLMKSALSLLVLFAAVVISASATDTRLFELRTYYANPGKLDALHARFRDHTVKLFEKHGMTNMGYWTPDENEDNTLVYVLAYKNRKERDAAWKAFLNDPDWKQAYADSTNNGKDKLVKRVDRVFLQATDYSPLFKAEQGDGERKFQLRTYTAAPGKLDALHARFRDHTVKLFEKHGFTNVVYWSPIEKRKGAENTLIYLLAGNSSETFKAGFDGFRKDPEWQSARAESEKDGKLTTKVVGVFMSPTDYSPTR